MALLRADGEASESGGCRCRRAERRAAGGGGAEAPSRAGGRRGRAARVAAGAAGPERGGLVSPVRAVPSEPFTPRPAARGDARRPPLRGSGRASRRPVGCPEARGREAERSRDRSLRGAGGRRGGPGRGAGRSRLSVKAPRPARQPAGPACRFPRDAAPAAAGSGDPGTHGAGGAWGGDVAGPHRAAEMGSGQVSGGSDPRHPPGPREWHRRDRRGWAGRVCSASKGRL